MTPLIRPYRDGDGPACHDVYIDAVRNGTAPAYTPAQARAWAPSTTDDGEWSHRLATGATWVAEHNADIVGFITLTHDSYLDLFFVRPSVRPYGTAAALYDTLMAHARNRGTQTLSTHASHIARRFLERRGWRVLHEETVTRHGVDLTRFLMSLEKIDASATES